LTNQEKKFYDLWQKLDDLTKKASEEIAQKPVSTEPGEELVSLEDVGLDAPVGVLDRQPTKGSTRGR
jgi:hypothetical protein